MKKTFLLILVVLFLTACSQTQAVPTATVTPIPPTATLAPTATNTPEPTLTPTPLPYYLEDGSLFDLEEGTGEYTLVGEGLAAITTSAEGIVAVDGDGLELFRYENGEWVEVERVFHSGVEAIPDVVARAEEETGMDLSEVWGRAKEAPIYFTATYYQDGMQGRMFMSLGHETVVLENGDKVLCLYGYAESPQYAENSQYTVSIPVAYIKKSGSVHPMPVVSNYYESSFEPRILESITSYDDLLNFMNENIPVGDVFYADLEVDWDRNNSTISRVYEYFYGFGRFEYIEPFLTDDYIARLIGVRNIRDAVAQLEEGDMGLFAVKIDLFLFDNVSDQ